MLSGWRWLNGSHRIGQTRFQSRTQGRFGAAFDGDLLDSPWGFDGGDLHGTYASSPVIPTLMKNSLRIKVHPSGFQVSRNVGGLYAVPSSDFTSLLSQVDRSTRPVPTG